MPRAGPDSALQAPHHITRKALGMHTNRHRCNAINVTLDYSHMLFVVLPLKGDNSKVAETRGQLRPATKRTCCASIFALTEGEELNCAPICCLLGQTDRRPNIMHALHFSTFRVAVDTVHPKNDKSRHEFRDGSVLVAYAT